MLFHKDAFNTFKECGLLNSSKGVSLSEDILETIRDYLLFMEMRDRVYGGLVKSKPMSYCPETRDYGVGNPCSEREYTKHGIHPGRLCLNKIKDIHDVGWVDRGLVPLIHRIQIEKVSDIKNSLYLWGYRLIQYSTFSPGWNERICLKLRGNFRKENNQMMVFMPPPPTSPMSDILHHLGDYAAATQYGDGVDRELNDFGRMLLDREKLEELEKLNE
jgi:hypothetical protein